MSWVDLAVSQDGVVSRGQLNAAHVSNAKIARMLATAELVTVAARVFLVRGAPLTYRARLWSAVLATDGVLGYATAAELWGVSSRRPDRVHVVLPHARRVYPPPWVRVHRVHVPRSSMREQSGLPITTRSWTLLDHLPTLRSGERSRLADRAVQQGWLTQAQILDRLRAHPCRTGNTALRLLAQQLSDGAAAESERRMHRLLRQIGIDGWAPNYPVWHDGELVAVVDIALPDRRVAIEIDGWAFHHDVDRFQRDRARQNDLIVLGWTMLRFTWADLIERPGYVRAMVARVAA